MPPARTNGIQGIPFRKREFEEFYPKEVELARKLHADASARISGADFHDVDHYVNVAAYLHTIGADMPTMLAGLFHFLAPYKNQYKNLQSELRRIGHERADSKYVTYILDKYGQIREQKGIDINANMILHIQSPDQRASIMRAVDIMLNLDDRVLEDKRNRVKWEDSFVRLVEEIYLPITHTLGLHKLHRDLGYRLMALQHPKKLAEIEAYLGENAGAIKRRGESVIETLERKLRNSLNLEPGVHYEIIPRPEGYADPSLGIPVKSRWRIHKKMLENRWRDPKRIPDLIAWMLVLNTQGWSDLERLRKLKEIDALLRSERVNVVHSEISSYLNDHPFIEEEERRRAEAEEREPVPLVETFPYRSRSEVGFQSLNYPISHFARETSFSGAELQVTTDAWHEDNEAGPANAVFGRAEFPRELKAALTALSNYIKINGLPSKLPFTGMLESPVHVQHFDAEKNTTRVFSLPEGSTALDLFARLHEHDRSPPLLPMVLINGSRSSLAMRLSPSDLVQFTQIRSSEARPEPEPLIKEGAYLLSTKRFLVPYLPARTQFKYRFLRRR